MCKNRKYQKYAIQVEYLSGDKETINLAGIRTDLYSKMLDVYRSVKVRYEDKAKTISFCGVGNTGELNILFTKEVKQAIDDKDGIRENTKDISKLIADNVLKLKNKYFYHKEMIPILEKKQDVVLHMIEQLKDGSDKEKLKLLEELQEIRKERRWNKTELNNIKILQNHNMKSDELNFTHLNNIFNDKTIQESSSEFEFDMRIAKKEKLYIEEVYKDEKQLNKIKKDYERVYLDSTINKIYAYNKCKKAI